MADQKISELTALSGTSVSASDEFVIVDKSDSQTKRLRVDQLKTWVEDQTTFNFKEFVNVGTTSIPSQSNRGVGIHADETENTIRISNLPTTSQIVMRFYNANGIVGFVVTNGNSTLYNTSSDYRLKENEVELQDACSVIANLPVYTFNFKSDPNTAITGFFAHELAEVVPNAVTGSYNEVDPDGNPVYQAVDHSKLIPYLTACIKELTSKVDVLKGKVELLEGSSA